MSGPFKNLYFLLTLGFVFYSCPLGCAQIHRLQSEKRIECVISSKHLNRIQVEGDRIAAVYGGDSHYAIETDEVGGQLFLKATRGTVTSGVVTSGSKTTLYISFLTEGEVTQDLKLTPRDVDAQTLIFKPGADTHPVGASKGKDYNLSKSSLTGDVYTSDLLHLIKELVCEEGDEIAKGDSKDKVLSKDLWAKTLKVTIKKRLFSNGLVGEVLEVVNQGNTFITLTPTIVSKIMNTKALAIALEHSELAPYQKTHLFVVSQEIAEESLNENFLNGTRPKESSLKETSLEEASLKEPLLGREEGK